MHHRTCLRPLAIHRKMQEAFLGGLVATNELALVVQLRQPRGIEAAQR